MAKYVCDFSKVKENASTIIDTAEEMLTEINNYSDNISLDVKSWDGSTKTEFDNAKIRQVELAKADCEYAKKFGKYIKLVANEIETLDSDISKQSL